jgi:signal peptidase I
VNLRRLVFGSNPRRTSIRILVLAAVTFVTLRWILIPVRTQGISMLPTFESGRLHFVSRMAYAFGSPARGDIVAIRLAGPHVLYIKRVVALPGERVRIVEGQVQINGVGLAEPYVRNRRPWDAGEVQLSTHEYFVAGDNRGMAAGDHDFGPVDGERIIGKVVF